jgi:hypothetical protein
MALQDLLKNFSERSCVDQRSRHLALCPAISRRVRLSGVLVGRLKLSCNWNSFYFGWQSIPVRNHAIIIASPRSISSNIISCFIIIVCLSEWIQPVPKFLDVIFRTLCPLQIFISESKSCYLLYAGHPVCEGHLHGEHDSPSRHHGPHVRHQEHRPSGGGIQAAIHLQAAYSNPILPYRTGCRSIGVQADWTKVL